MSKSIGALKPSNFGKMLNRNKLSTIVEIEIINSKVKYEIYNVEFNAFFKIIDIF